MPIWGGPAELVLGLCLCDQKWVLIVVEGRICAETPLPSEMIPSVLRRTRGRRGRSAQTG